MIESLMFYRFHTREYLSFSDRVLTCTDRYDLEGQGISAPVASVRIKQTQLSGTMTKAVLTEFTEDVVGADATRDDAFGAFKFFLQACQKSGIEEWKDSADLLLARIRHYGWNMNKSSFSKQSTQTLNLLSDLETIINLADAVEAIEATQWVDRLRVAQSNFEQSLIARTKAKANQTKLSNDDACRELRQAYESLFIVIEALQMISPLDDRASLIDEINTIIKEFNITVKLRTGRLESAE